MLMPASACRKDRVTIHDQQTIPDIDDVCDEAEEAQRQVLPCLILILLASHVSRRHHSPGRQS